MKAKTYRTIKPVPEMAQDMKNEKLSIAENPKTRGQYSKQTPENDLRLSMAIKTRVDTLRNDDRIRVNFRDLEDVKRRTWDYLDACAIASVYPSMLGLAVYGYGISKVALYNHLTSHPEAEETHFIRKMSDAFADILVNDSLKRRCDCVSAIFVLKNLYGFRDNVDIPVVEVTDNTEHDSIFYREKYGDLDPD